MKVPYSRLAKAKSFDRPNYWRHFGTRLANLAEIPEGVTLLDVGTGSGSVLIPVAEEIGDNSLGIGADIHFGVLGLFLPRIEKRNLMNTALTQMDIRSLGFMDGSFDYVLSGFVGWDGCFDFAKLDFTGSDTKMAEILRVLKMGGRVGISSWTEQEDLDWLGEQFQRHLPAYAAEQGIGTSWIAYSKENVPGFEMILRAGNFQDIEITTETEDFISADEEEWWQQVWGAGWWVQIDRLAGIDADRLKQFKEIVFENLQDRKDNDGIHFSKTALFAFGRKAL